MNVGITMRWVNLKIENGYLNLEPEQLQLTIMKKIADKHYQNALQLI